ncbi:acetylserotonin O-methyltransferase [Prosthecochloris sp. SCSIO W1101]|uniref:methyltransferase family protein n=1 Tax=Prosthecochloris sp. SCSIO W1101 TaxID=2992242 RepID=UPI00223DC94F|nr:methyltransferase dimerization domain-containing protein [Prosthecochloris sp. SCSIO W1101]UZJ40731.1 acetylserotonin O-methyltransferase [Prosthecochloris sp. SCSIO W1101]
MKLPVLNSPYSQINNLLYKSYLPQIINSAVEAGLFDVLSGKSLSLRDVAKELNTDEQITGALLRILVAIDFMKEQDGRYSLTVLAEEYLVSNSLVNQLEAVKMFSEGSSPFDGLKQALKGDIKRFSGRMWVSEKAVLAMERSAKAGEIQAAVSFIKSMPDFHGAAKMCDFAGGTGYYSFAFLHENRNLHSHVYDLPEVCSLAKELKCREENFDRIAYHDFSGLEIGSFGNDYDVFFISRFLYECRDETVLRTFLKEVNRCMKTGGVFISSHIASCSNKECGLTIAMVELMTRAKGYPVYKLSVNTLKDVLGETGFGEITIQQPNENIAFPVQLLAARKTKDAE